MKQRFISVVLLFSIVSFAYGQKIEIGQDAEEVKAIVEYTTKQHNRTDSYGKRASSRWQWDAKYFDGKVAEVVQCYSNQYLVDVKVVANYCKYFMMEKGRLAFVLTQYENLSVENLKELQERVSGGRRIGEYYFSEDFKHYSRIFLHSNGLATVEWRAANITNLPKNIQVAVAQKQKSAEDVVQQKQEIEKEKQSKEEEERINKIKTSQEYFATSELANRSVIKLSINKDAMNALNNFINDYNAGLMQEKSSSTTEKEMNFTFDFVLYTNKLGNIDKVEANVLSERAVAIRKVDMPKKYYTVLANNIKSSESGNVKIGDSSYPVNSTFRLYIGSSAPRKEYKLKIAKNKNGDIKILSHEAETKAQMIELAEVVKKMEDNAAVKKLDKGKYFVTVASTKGKLSGVHNHNLGQREELVLDFDEVELVNVEAI